MNDLLKNLKTAIFSVFEQMFFLISDENGDQSKRLFEGYSVYIGITGKPSYIITLTFEKELANTMAIVLLGLNKEEVPNDIIHTCLKETVNVVAGKFLLSFEELASMDMTLPAERKDNLFEIVNFLDSQIF